MVTTAQRTLQNYYQEQAAESARNTLQSAGFSNEQLSVVKQIQPVRPPIKWTQTRRSAIGGAIAGGLCGLNVGLLVSMAIPYLPSGTNASPGIPPILAILVCVIVGGVGGGLIGAATGNYSQKPERTDQQATISIYTLTIKGSDEDLIRASDILRSQTN